MINAIICDLDGTLFDCKWRKEKFLPNFNEFNKNKKVINFDYSEDGLIPDGLCSIDSNIDTPIIRLANEILDEEEFKIVMMYTVGEYKHREIAELLNLPLGTVTWKYKNSLNKIRTELEKREKNAEQRIRKTA